MIGSESGTLIFRGGARVVLARHEAGLLSTYGVTAAAASGITLKNGGGDVISVANASTAIDTVDCAGWTVTPGVAWERDDSEPAVWCDADEAIGVTSDLGSPGQPNGACAQLAWARRQPHQPAMLRSTVWRMPPLR